MLKLEGLQEDKVATTKSVEKMFEQYRAYKRRLKMVGKTDVEISEDKLKEMKSVCSRVEETLSLLNEKHTELLTLKYIKSGEVMRDLDVYLQVKVSERTYYRLKWVAIKEFANCLGLVVYKDVTES